MKEASNIIKFNPTTREKLELPDDGIMDFLLSKQLGFNGRILSLEEKLILRNVLVVILTTKEVDQGDNINIGLKDTVVKALVEKKEITCDGKPVTQKHKQLFLKRIRTIINDLGRGIEIM